MVKVEAMTLAVLTMFPPTHSGAVMAEDDGGLTPSHPSLVRNILVSRIPALFINRKLRLLPIVDGLIWEASQVRSAVFGCDPAPPAAADTVIRQRKSPVLTELSTPSAPRDFEQVIPDTPLWFP
jgi:hypothetical protein